MLVRDRMTRQPVTTEPDAPLHAALKLMREHRVHRLPVLQDGTLVGIVTERDAMYARLLNNNASEQPEMDSETLTVRQIMTSEVVTVSPDCPIEQAAAMMADHTISALPVVEGSESRTLVGIITETDIFTVFVEMLSARSPGVRASLEIDNRKGALASLFNRIVEVGGLVVTVSSFPAASPQRIRIILKVADVDVATMRGLLKPEEVAIDIREILLSHHAT